MTYMDSISKDGDTMIGDFTFVGDVSVTELLSSKIEATSDLTIKIDSNEEVKIAPNKMTFNNGFSDTSLDWTFNAKLRFHVGVPEEIVFEANKITFNNGAIDTGFDWSVNGKLDLHVGGATEFSFETKGLTFNNGVTDVALWSDVDGVLGIAFGGSKYMEMYPSKIVLAVDQVKQVQIESPGSNRMRLQTDGGVNTLMEIDGKKLSFYGVTTVGRPAGYTVSNANDDRSYDANSTSIDELADVLATVIEDLQLFGLLK